MGIGGSTAYWLRALVFYIPFAIQFLGTYFAEIFAQVCKEKYLVVTVSL